MSSDSDTEHFLADWYICKICRNVFHSKQMLYDHKRNHFFDYVETASEGTRRRRCAEWVAKTQTFMEHMWKLGFIEDDPLPYETIGKTGKSASNSVESSLSSSSSRVVQSADTSDGIEGKNQINGQSSIDKSSSNKKPKKSGNATARRRAPVKRKKAPGPAAVMKAKMAKKATDGPQQSAPRKNVASCRKSPSKSEPNRNAVAVEGGRLPKAFRIGMDVEVTLKQEDYRLCSDCGKTFLSTGAYDGHLKSCSGLGTKQRRSRRILTKVNSNKNTSLTGHGQCGRRMCTAC